MFFELPQAALGDEEILEKLRIRELVEYERYCTDYGHRKQRDNCWFSDGEIFTTWFKGRYTDYAVASPVKIDSENPPKRDSMDGHGHRVNNTVVWLNKNKAVAELICQLNFRVNLGGTWADLTCNARMHYRLEKREGRWGIIYLEGIYEKDRMTPVFGDSEFTVPEKLLRKYRPCNWNMALRRDLYEGDLQYADEWAGPDKPETIEKLYNATSEWIFS